MTRPGAFIFDLNGTMIDDMEFHTIAWTTILNDDLRAGLTRDEVRRQMYGKNEELLDRVFGKADSLTRKWRPLPSKKKKATSPLFFRISG